MLLSKQSKKKSVSSSFNHQFNHAASRMNMLHLYCLLLLILQWTSLCASQGIAVAVELEFHPTLDDFAGCSVTVYVYDSKDDVVTSLQFENPAKPNGSALLMIQLPSFALPLSNQIRIDVRTHARVMIKMFHTISMCRESWSSNGCIH
jgi:hypothetical protein